MHPMPQLTDKVLIQAILETERPWTAYALADLEPGYCEHAVWFCAAAGLPALALLYRAFALPVLLTVGESRHLRSVLDEVDRALDGSRHVYVVVRPDVFTLLQERYRVSHEQAMLLMVLAPRRYQPAVPKGVRRLGCTDLERVRRLYADGEATGEAPDFFMPAMLEQGVYYGVYEGDWLIAAAGTHVVAPTVSVGALGNVYTRRDRRGRGLASRITSAVINHLLDMKISTVALNVRENNHAAIRVYEQLGFQTHCHYYEAIASR
jgi:ribosomal protein S18 acetylase RimI-like enzyme